MISEYVCIKHNSDACNECVKEMQAIEFDRDSWKAQAEKLAELLNISRGQWIHSVHKEQMLEALADYARERGKE